jgi:hypothetical protein
MANGNLAISRRAPPGRPAGESSTNRATFTRSDIIISHNVGTEPSLARFDVAQARQNNTRLGSPIPARYGVRELAPALEGDESGVKPPHSIDRRAGLQWTPPGDGLRSRDTVLTFGPSDVRPIHSAVLAYVSRNTYGATPKLARRASVSATGSRATEFLSVALPHRLRLIRPRSRRDRQRHPADEHHQPTDRRNRTEPFDSRRGQNV